MGCSISDQGNTAWTQSRVLAARHAKPAVEWATVATGRRYGLASTTAGASDERTDARIPAAADVDVRQAPVVPPGGSAVAVVLPHEGVAGGQWVVGDLFGLDGLLVERELLF